MFGGLVEAPLIPTDNKYQVWFPNISNLYQNFLSFLNLVVVDIPFFFFLCQGTNNTFVFTDKSGQPTVYHSTGIVIT